MANSKKSISKMAELKSIIGNALIDSKNKQFPIEILYSRGIVHPKFKIIIEQIEEDFFIDANGIKWRKVLDNEEND